MLGVSLQQANQRLRRDPSSDAFGATFSRKGRRTSSAANSASYRTVAATQLTRSATVFEVAWS
jgi:hypothetical protein